MASDAIHSVPLLSVLIYSLIKHHGLSDINLQTPFIEHTQIICAVWVYGSLTLLLYVLSSCIHYSAFYNMVTH